MSSLIRFFRRRENWPILIIPVLLALWAQFAAMPLALGSFDSFMLPDSIYTGVLGPGEEAEPIAERVVIIVVDGLREDVSRQLPTLNSLRDQGADRVLVTRPVSLTNAVSTVIATGAWQEQSGVNSNFYEDEVALDTIFDAAHRAGLTTGLAGSKEWRVLFGPDFDVSQTPEGEAEYMEVEPAVAYDVEITDAAVAVLGDQPDLTLVHLIALDHMGHAFGGTSEEYLETALAADANIARMLEVIDLNTTAVLITADHGHTDRGGHGGSEPEVLHVPLVSVGQGIRPGEYPEAAQADLASTVAALLGTSIPSHGVGSPLLDQIDAPEALLASRAIDHAEQVSIRYQSMLDAIDAPQTIRPTALDSARTAFEAGNYQQALIQADEAVSHAQGAWEFARTARLNRERLGRLPVALILLLLPLLYLWWWFRAGWDWRAPLVGTLIYFALWYLNYLVIGDFRFSLSMFNYDAEIEPFFTNRVIESMGILLLIMLVIGVWRHRAGLAVVARDAVNTLFLVGFGLMLQILFFYVLWDIVFEWYLPNPTIAMKYYLDLFQTTAFWPMIFLPVGLLLPLIALLAAWVARLITGTRASHPTPVPVS